MTSQTLARSLRGDGDQTRSARGLIERHWRLVVLSFVGWSLLAAIPTTSAYLGSGAPGFGPWWAMFKKIGLYYYLWGLAAPLLYRLTIALPIRGRRLALTIAAHLAVFVSLSFAFGLITHQDAWREWLFGVRAVGYHSMSAFTYALIVLCCLTTRFYRLSLLHEREAKNAMVLAAQLDSKLNLARVDSLRMQMNPHFLFNALNSVAALIDTNRPERAYQAVEQLGALLRRALNLSQEAEVTLDDELDFCRTYLSLEHIRFGERLDVRWQIDDAVRGAMVPAFILQPLAENAIKHAVSHSSQPVAVTIAAHATGSMLELCVSDTGSAIPARDTVTATGLGLANLRERLALRYGMRARVETHAAVSGFATRVRMPLSRDPDRHQRAQSSR